MSSEPRAKCDDPVAIRALADYWHNEVGPALRGTTHYEGCETDHKNCGLWVLSRYILLLEQTHD